MTCDLNETLSLNQAGTILVLEQYRDMIKRIFARYKDTLAQNAGGVVTGQPGVGKVSSKHSLANILTS